MRSLKRIAFRQDFGKQAFRAAIRLQRIETVREAVSPCMLSLRPFPPGAALQRIRQSPKRVGGRISNEAKARRENSHARVQEKEFTPAVPKRVL